MTFGALRYGLMHPAMTCDAGQAAMFGVTQSKKPVFLLVTGPAIFRGNLVAIGNMKRHMSLMASTTVSHGHIGQMTGVAGETGGLITVPGVARGTVKGGMHTGVFL